MIRDVGVMLLRMVRRRERFWFALTIRPSPRMTRGRFARSDLFMSKRTKRNDATRLIVAASENDPDMLYATRFFAPDAFIFLEQNGKRTLVLSDLEIDRGRKQATADEILPYSAFEKEVQGSSAKAPAYEKVLAHFLTGRK